jgi:hypothetical protein
MNAEQTTQALRDHADQLLVAVGKADEADIDLVLTVNEARKLASILLAAAIEIERGEGR